MSVSGSARAVRIADMIAAWAAAFMSLFMGCLRLRLDLAGWLGKQWPEFFLEVGGPEAAAVLGTGEFVGPGRLLQ